MKKSGFTLAEVLITLGLLGVVAALTLPALMHNTEKHAYMNGLKAMNNILTNGFAQMLATEGVDSLRDTELWSECVGSTTVANDIASDANKCVDRNMKKYFTITKIEDGKEGGTIYDIWGQDSSAIVPDFEKKVRYTFPNNATINIEFNGNGNDKTRSECGKIKEDGGSMCKQTAYMWVDVNGNKKPNWIGKDLYLYRMDEKGRLYPNGGKDANLFAGNDMAPLWKTNCEGKPLKNSSCSDYKSTSLTGRVIEEGYNITYY